MEVGANGAPPLTYVGPGSAANDAYYQISDDEVDDCDDLGDDYLMGEKESSGSNVTPGRGPYERAWTTDATRALIHIRGPMEGRFTEGRQKRTALWLHCTRQLQKLGYRYNAAKVQKKWHNILITYNKNLNKKYMSGYVHWEFFEEMFKYLQGKKADFEIQQLQQQLQPQPQQQQQQRQSPTISQQSSQLPQTIQQMPPLQPQPRNATDCKFMSGDDEVPLQPQVQIDTKSNDDFDEDSTTMSDVKELKQEYHNENSSQFPLDLPHPNSYERNGNSNGGAHGDYLRINDSEDEDHSEWWKDYFERKLEVDREKMQLQRGMHRELMQFNKMSLVQQEKIERIKIDAINNLTCTLQKLVEVKTRKT